MNIETKIAKAILDDATDRRGWRQATKGLRAMSTQTNNRDGQTMDFQGLHNLTIGELLKLNDLEKMTVVEALPLIREFRDKHGLDDRQAKNAYRCAQRLITETN